MPLIGHFKRLIIKKSLQIKYWDFKGADGFAMSSRYLPTMFVLFKIDACLIQR